MKVLCLLLLTLMTFCAVESIKKYDIRDAPKLFYEFTQKYHKNYPSAVEYFRRYLIFVENLKEIIRINNKPNGTGDWAGINVFTDQTKEEMREREGIPPIKLLNGRRQVT